MFVCVHQDQKEPRGQESCPCVWALEGSPLIPVGFDAQVSLQGKNLDIFEVRQIFVWCCSVICCSTRAG